MTTLPPITNNPDIRFLGRLLGDVIRTYGGEALVKRIEHIRSTSVDRHRGVAGADAILTYWATEVATALNGGVR